MLKTMAPGLGRRLRYRVGMGGCKCRSRNKRRRGEGRDISLSPRKRIIYEKGENIGHCGAKKK